MFVKYSCVNFAFIVGLIILKTGNFFIFCMLYKTNKNKNPHYICTQCNEVLGKNREPLMFKSLREFADCKAE